jgi:hypothetical protein
MADTQNRMSPPLATIANRVFGKCMPKTEPNACADVTPNATIPLATVLTTFWNLQDAIEGGTAVTART